MIIFRIYWADLISMNYLSSVMFAQFLYYRKFKKKGQLYRRYVWLGNSHLLGGLASTTIENINDTEDDLSCVKRCFGSYLSCVRIPWQRNAESHEI